MSEEYVVVRCEVLKEVLREIEELKRIVQSLQVSWRLEVKKLTARASQVSR